MVIQGTVCLVADDTADEMTATIRAFELGFAMGRYDKRFTVKEVAQEFYLSLSGAYRLLTRASGSRKVMLIDDNGEWYVPSEIEARDWPY